MFEYPGNLKWKLHLDISKKVLLLKVAEQAGEKFKNKTLIERKSQICNILLFGSKNSIIQNIFYLR